MSLDLKISPENIVGDWGQLEDWENGTSSPPTEFQLSGTGASVAQETTDVKEGTFSAKVTSGSDDTQLYRDVESLVPNFEGKKFTFGAWVKCSTASKARVQIDDGVGVSSSGFHTGGGQFEFLQVTRDIDENATRLRIICFVDDVSIEAVFDGLILCEGTVLFQSLTSVNINVGRWRNTNQFSVIDFDISRRDGKRITDVKLLGRRITLSGDVYGTTVDQAKGYLDDLRKAFFVGRKDLYFQQDRIMKGFLDGFNHEPIRSSTLIKFDLRFRMDDVPILRFFNKKRTVHIVSGSPSTFSVTNDGTAEARPIYQFIAGGTSITSLILENLTTGELLSFTGTVNAGESLIIDTDELTVLNNGVDAIADFTNGDFIKLALGTNQFKFTGSDCTIKVDHFNGYY